MLRKAVTLLVVVTIGVGCVGPRRYTSLDLALLPCEAGAPPTLSGQAPFFRAVEFDSNGHLAFPRQAEQLRQRLHELPRVKDLVFFVHGWNKNPYSAEADYQNFLCRLYARLRVMISREKVLGELVVVGIFWPSTIANNVREPLFFTPVSYYRMRARADLIAKTGLADLFEFLIPDIALGRTGGATNPVRTQLIGHSFGGRMLLGSMDELRKRDKLAPLLGAAGTVNVVLLNAAVPPARFKWLREAVIAAKIAGTPGRFTSETDSYLFNVHSFNDRANRILFPLASVFDDDTVTCAAGACGVPSYATLCVNDSGQIDSVPIAAPSVPGERLNAWNVDASSIVFSHTDIYKGRIAALLADLVYDQKSKALYPNATDDQPEPEMRCKAGVGKENTPRR